MMSIYGQPVGEGRERTRIVSPRAVPVFSDINRPPSTTEAGSGFMLWGLWEMRKGSGKYGPLEEARSKRHGSGVMSVADPPWTLLDNENRNFPVQSSGKGATRVILWNCEKPPDVCRSNNEGRINLASPSISALVGWRGLAANSRAESLLQAAVQDAAERKGKVGVEGVPRQGGIVLERRSMRRTRSFHSRSARSYCPKGKLGGGGVRAFGAPHRQKKPD